MSEIKPGEVVRITLQQIDAENRIIMDMAVNWYGFTNEQANMMANGIIDGIQEVTGKFAEMKAKRDS